MTRTFTQKYTIVQFVDDVAEGYEFTPENWSLHVTIVDTFAIDWSVNEMVAELTDALQHYKPASSAAQNDSYFGENKQVCVTLLNRSKSLLGLHLDVLGVLEKGGLALNDPQFAGSGFRPHATVQKHARLHKGNEVKFAALSIVNMFPGNNPHRRKVLKTIQLGNA